MSTLKQILSGLILSAVLLLPACGRAPDVGEAEVVNVPSDETEISLDLWLERMEVGSREIYSARFNVADAVQLQAGETIADVGAGTGLYTLIFAERAGERGSVYAIDIEPRFLKLINQRASDLEFGNVTAVLGRNYSITLPENTLDVAFISDTYNYFEDPLRIMKSVHTALREDGRLFLLEFDISENIPRTEQNAHVRVGKRDLAREVEAAGFRLVDEVTVEGLQETYLLAFRKK